ncbi:hypothetical protein FQN49_005092 [Arthroderma sp. PD_2]|nr:hypothetical protein FQN49_005092 [Arthroderma sp. PD_2]
MALAVACPESDEHPFHKTAGETLFHALLDALTLLLIIGSFVPQLVAIVTGTNTAGISPWYILLLTITSSTLLLSRASNAYTLPLYWGIRDGLLGGWKALYVLLIFIEVFVQWACTVALLGIYLTFRNDQESPDYPPHHVGLSNRAILGIGITYLMITLGVTLAFFITASSKNSHSIPYRGIQHTCQAILTPFGLGTALTSAIPQIHLIIIRYHSGRGLGSLSILSLGLQFLAFVVLGVSQGLRLYSISESGHSWMTVDVDEPRWPARHWWDTVLCIPWVGAILLLFGTMVVSVALGLSQLVLFSVALGIGRSRSQL